MESRYCDELPKPEKNILYVVFHGELAFFDRDNDPYIRVYAPQVPTHIFIAGSWLGERHIPRGTTLELQGVKAGTGSLDDSRIVRLGLGSEARPVAAHFEIRLPRPACIHDGMIIDCAGAIQGPNGPLPVRRMDLRPIFEYEMTSKSAFLSDLDHPEHEPAHPHTWRAREGCPGYYSLHVFAEEDTRFNDDDDHAEKAFEQASHVLGVNGMKVVRTGEPHLGKLPPGLYPDEVYLTLYARTEVLADLGQQVREGHHHLVWNSQQQITKEVLALDSHASCGPVGN
jgi:hypothetical protein